MARNRSPVAIRRRELPTQHEALTLERSESRLDFVIGEAKRSSHRCDCHRPQALQAQAHQLDHGFLARPGAG